MESVSRRRLRGMRGERSLWASKTMWGSRSITLAAGAPAEMRWAMRSKLKRGNLSLPLKRVMLTRPSRPRRRMPAESETLERLKRPTLRRPPMGTTSVVSSLRPLFSTPTPSTTSAIPMPMPPERMLAVSTRMLAVRVRSPSLPSSSAKRRPEPKSNDALRTSAIMSVSFRR